MGTAQLSVFKQRILILYWKPLKEKCQPNLSCWKIETELYLKHTDDVNTPKTKFQYLSLTALPFLNVNVMIKATIKQK